MRPEKIEHGEIHIWKVEIPACLSKKQQLLSYLSEQEADRALRYRFEKDCNRFVITRGLLRSLLGRYLNEEPSKISIEYNLNGKPFIKNHKTINFNLSYAENLSLIALTVGQQVGVDVELRKPDINFNGIVEASFTKEERNKLKQVSEVTKVDLFYKMWTRKEALIKAKGGSLAHFIDGFDESDPFDETEWFVNSFNPGKKYQAAVASHKNPDRILFCN